MEVRSFALAMAAVLAISHSQAAFADDEKAAEAKGPESVIVEAERLHVELKLDGRFDTVNTQQVAFAPKAWAKLEVAEAVSHGSPVQAGKRLIRLELEELERAVVAAEQDLELANLGVESAEVSLEALRRTTPMDIEAAERAVAEARDDLEYFLEVSKQQSIESVEESIKRAKYSLEYAQEELDQLRQMYEADDLTEETEEIILKRAQRSVESSERSLKQTEVRSERTLETDLPRQERSLRESTEKQEVGLQKAVTSLKAGIRQAEIDIERKRVERQRAERKLDELRADLEMLSEITADFDGYVYYGQVGDGTWSGKDKSDNYLKVGGSIPAKTVVLTVVPASVTHLHVEVAETDVFSVRNGMAVSVSPAANPKVSIEGVIESVSRVPDSGGSFKTVIRLNGRAENIVAAMKGTAKLTVYDNPAAVLVPEGCVFSDEGERVVYLKKGGRRKVVETGRDKGDKVEITNGLSAGAEILITKPEDK